MCGIVGYVGHRQAQEVVIEGLRRLEYRGYDSAGVAVIGGAGMQTAKKAGRIENLDKELASRSISGSTGMGHTRWATHGAPNDGNAHPHTSMSGRVAVVHNGIIENFSELRSELEAAGIEFSSETDTETVAHLVDRELERGAGSLFGSRVEFFRERTNEFWTRARRPGRCRSLPCLGKSRRADHQA